MREHFHDKFIVKAKSSVSSHDQSKHSKNQSQTDASVWNRVVSSFPQIMVKVQKTSSVRYWSNRWKFDHLFIKSIDELLKVSKQTLSRTSTRPKNAINRIITAKVNQKLRTSELKDLKNIDTSFCSKNKQHDPRPWRKNRSTIHEAWKGLAHDIYDPHTDGKIGLILALE